MLFNSLDYILFLGIAVAGFWLLARHAKLRIVFIAFWHIAVTMVIFKFY